MKKRPKVPKSALATRGEFAELAAASKRALEKMWADDKRDEKEARDAADFIAHLFSGWGPDCGYEDPDKAWGEEGDFIPLTPDNLLKHKRMCQDFLERTIHDDDGEGSKDFYEKQDRAIGVLRRHHGLK